MAVAVGMTSVLRAAGPLHAAQAAAATVEQWRMVEISLASAKPHSDPFNTVMVTATFTHGHDRLVRPAFWDGGSIWKIRFAPPALGIWAYSTTCSDNSDSGLQGQHGVIRAVPYRGALAVYKHGFLKVSENHRYFTYADGTPFFYLGDTHWEAMHERFETSNLPGCASQFKCEVDKRVAQGFTVYQSEWMAGGPPTPDEPIYNWDDGISDADMPGFHNADQKFQYLADKGLVVANAMNWRDLIPKYSDDYLKKLGRYWAARYGAYPVLWTMGQETDGSYPKDPPDLDQKWQVVAQALSENDAYHQPLSAHMCNTGSVTASTSPWRLKPYHTWYAAQVQGPPLPPGCARDFWDSLPTKPAVVYEPPYENFWTDAAGERTRAYVAFLSGFYGFGYGVAGVWDDNYTCTPVRDSGTTYDPNCKPWYDGLSRPSGDQMTLVRQFFTSIAWWKLEPRFDSSQWRLFIHPSEARLASDGWKTFVACFYNKDTDTGSLKQMNNHTTYSGRWYNPRTGKYTLISRSIQPDASGAWAIPPKPDALDWVLLLQANHPNAAPPRFARPAIVMEGNWPLAGSLTDSTGRLGPAKVVGGSFSTGPAGRFVSLSGNDSYVEIPSGATLDGMGQLTVSIRVRLHALPARNAAILDKEFSYRLSVDSHGNWHFEVATTTSPWYAPGTAAASTRPIQVGKWAQLVGGYDGQSIRVYQDGQPCGESQLTGAGSVAKGAAPLDLGRSNSVNMDAMSGDLSDLRIYGAALSPEQVQALSTANAK
jgi:hypothetical protein